MTGVSHEIKCECCDLHETRVFEGEIDKLRDQHLREHPDHIVVMVKTTIIPGIKYAGSNIA